MAHSDIFIFFNTIFWTFLCFFFIYLMFVLYLLPNFFKRIRLRTKLVDTFMGKTLLSVQMQNFLTISFHWKWNSFLLETSGHYLLKSFKLPIGNIKNNKDMEVMFLKVPTFFLKNNFLDFGVTGYSMPDRLPSFGEDPIAACYPLAIDFSRVSGGAVGRSFESTPFWKIQRLLVYGDLGFVMKLNDELATRVESALKHSVEARSAYVSRRIYTYD